jgi:hypothetical protein
MDLAVVQYEIHFSGQHDNVVDGFGLVHARVPGRIDTGVTGA